MLKLVVLPYQNSVWLTKNNLNILPDFDGSRVGHKSSKLFSPSIPLHCFFLIKSYSINDVTNALERNGTSTWVLVSKEQRH